MYHISKFIFLIAIMFFTNYNVYSQGAIKKQRKLSDKIFFGGGIGMQFGSYTGVDVSPMVGYRLINNLQTGIKFTYQYYGGSNVSWQQNVIGGSLFAQYIFFNKFIAHAEYEVLNVHTSWKNNQYEDTKQWFYTPLLGGGLYQKIGNRAAIMLLILYDVGGSTNSPYQNPIIKISVIL